MAVQPGVKVKNLREINKALAANPIHWGWGKRNIRPQPFFVRALGYTRSEIYDNYFKQMEKLILEETAKTKL